MDVNLTGAAREKKRERTLRARTAHKLPVVSRGGGTRARTCSTLIVAVNLQARVDWRACTWLPGPRTHIISPSSPRRVRAPPRSMIIALCTLRSHSTKKPREAAETGKVKQHAMQLALAANGLKKFKIRLSRTGRNLDTSG